MSTAYHPQTDGQTERVNQCIEAYLRCMLLNQPKNWVKWLLLAEYWYNTNFHSSLKTSPFQALYGYAPPQLPLGSPPRSTVEGVNEMMNERHEWIRNLKEQLKKSQDRMKKFADAKRLERQFKVGTWVYLKLQLYRQVTVKGRKNVKLSPKFYGPFEIIAKIGAVAYELNLPPGTQIHPVFHVSQLKERVGNGQAITPGIPLTYPQFKFKENPEGILGRRMLKRNNEAVPQLLIKWKNQDEENASWEDYAEIKKKFPNFILKDKDNLEKEGVSDPTQPQIPLRLLAIEKFDSVNVERKNRKGSRKSGQELEVINLRLKGGSHETGREMKRLGQGKDESLTVGPNVKDVNEIDGVNEALKIRTEKARE